MRFDLVLAMLLVLCCASAGAVQLRPRISLDGKWQLSVAGRDAPYTVNVPGTWQAQVPELRGYQGRAVYSRNVTVPAGWQGKGIYLHFGAVDYRAEVLVNGTRVGEHEGGYTPFEFEVSDHLKLGEANDIRVEVVDPGADNPAEGITFEDIPHGKQSWYGNASGLWQSVYLEARNPAHIERIAVYPDIDNGKASIKIALTGDAKGRLHLTMQVPKKAASVRGAAVDLFDGGQEITWNPEIPRAALWSPDSPSLYTVKADLIVDGKVVDSLSAKFGMRKIEAKDGRILLNGKPIFIAAALDQDFYPFTEYAVPSDEYLKDQFLKAKELGLNMLRCHIKVPDPRYLDWADRLGLLVWYEIPNWKQLTEDAKRRGRETLEAMFLRDHNHPSLVIVSIINEAWGVDVKDEDHRKWMTEMYDYAKSLDPSRLVVDNSACAPNFHVKTDIEDFHAYFQIPDQAPLYRQWIEDFSKHPDWTFAPTPDKQRRGFEPLMLSEFGNWGLPRVSGLEKAYGGDPWWFGERRRATRVATSAAGVQDRFAEFGLDRVFGTLDGLADAYQDQQWLSLKFQIEEMRKYPSIVGYVITEFTDLHWEANGLLDWLRNPKTFHNQMHTVQEQDIVFAHPGKRNYTSGESVILDAWVSHFTLRDLGGGTLTWKVAGGPRGEIGLESIPQGDARGVGRIEFPAPEVDTPKRLRVILTLLDARRKTVAENYEEILVFAAAQPDMPADVIVSGKLDQETLAKIRKGSNAVICVESLDGSLLMRDGFQIVDRAVDGRSGAWCNSVTWFKDSPAFSGAPVPRTTDFTFENIIPTCVIEGIDPEHWADDVLSGLFVGWVQTHAAVVAQLRCGRGKVILTTLPLVSRAARDPMARFLLASLARYVASPECSPRLSNRLGVVQFDHTFLSTAERGGARWRYTTEQPAEGWETPGFDDSEWKQGKSGFGTTGTPNSHVGTIWDKIDIWIRYSGEIEGEVSEALLRLYHDEDAEVYLNGKSILSLPGYAPNYENHLLGSDALAAFESGRNVIAIHCRQTVGGQFIDAGLQYSLKEK